MTTHPQKLPPMASTPVGPAVRPGASLTPPPWDAPGTPQVPASLPPRREAGTSGDRTWTITLPPSMELLNSNDRDAHWARRKRITEALRQTAGWLARQQRIPLLERACIRGVYEPPDRRRRDPANLYPSFKACVDGLVDAGVFADDDADHVEGPDMRLGDVCHGGRIVLHITELAVIAHIGGVR